MSETQTQAASWRIDTWYPDLPPQTLKNLRVYHDELQRFNKTLNLVSPKTLPFADAIHFSDAILACRIIFNDLPAGETLYDLGSGNGIPGLVFAMMLPTKVVLVDSDQRKCEFLKHVIATCKLTNVEVLNTQIEKLPADSIRYATARGLASLSKAILLTRKQVVKGGAFYHMKSDNWPAEVGEIPTQLCSVWTPSLVGEYKLPVAGSVKMAVVKTDKIA